MAITTLDGLIAGMLPAEPILKASFTGEAAGQLHSLFYVAGRPGAAVAPTPGLAGAALTSYAGQLPFPAAAGGENVHVARLEATMAANTGGLILCDRLWHNSGFTQATTTAETVNSVAWPARDVNGSTNGVGVLVGLEVSTATTNAGAITNTTMSYTNDAGTSGRTATIPSFPATAVAGTFVPFQLAAGDTGVRSVQSLTKGTSYAAGTMHLVAYRPVLMLPLPVANFVNAVDGIGAGLPRMYDSSVPFLLTPLIGTAAGVVSGSITYTQG